ncbi:MAG TPA: ABC transporter permease [Chryseolinea sp.]|nr:ABC transporter permease [Chryseolinea sp.]HPM28949.1 ABC transporter permease [Chryseolinea sp.]
MQEKNIPPKFSHRLLEWICPSGLFEGIEGDLVEQFEEDIKTCGVRSAKRRFTWNVMRFLRPGIILRNRFSLQLYRLYMVKAYFKISLRHLMKDKVFSFINVIGLAIGMVAAFLIIQYVDFEMSYDRFHKNSDRIYRVCHNRYQDGILQYEKAQTFIPTGEVLKNEYPEVEDYTTLFKISDQAEIIISHYSQNGESIKFSEENVYHIKGNFFNIFSFPVVLGSRSITSIAPRTVLISRAIAEKYFGITSPLDKVIHHTYNGDYKVAGVFENIPQNSHIKPDFLFAWESASDAADGGDSNNWHWDGFYTYIKLVNNADVKTLETKLPEFTKKYLGTANDRIGESTFKLQPVADIHLNSHLLSEAGVNGDATVVGILKVLALFVLIMAYINYINLSSAKANDRAKEIGIRKIIGSNRRELISQFLLESLMINILACILAISIVIFFIMPYREVFGFEGSFNLLNEKKFWMWLISIVIVGSLASGLYPAFIISAFEPINVLKGKITSLGRGFSINLRRGMVTFQFMLSIVLITGSAFIYKQIRFMREKDLGMDINQTLVLRTFAKFGPPGSDSVFLKNLAVIKNELTTVKDIKGVTTSYDIPGKEHLSLFSNFRNVKNKKEVISLYYSRIDYNFIPLFEAKILSGRNFSEDIESDQQAIIVNKEALEEFGFDKPEDAIGNEVVYGREPNLRKVKIIGVVDFRATSFKEKNYPVVYQINWAPLRFLSIKFNQLNGNDINQNLSLIKQHWEKIFPEQPFDYFFLDDFFNAQYKSEQKFSTTLTLFTGLAIFIACLGLYGLSSLITVQRTKEIGIRKVLGASVKNIFLLISKDFGILTLVAGIISMPIVWYSISSWLESYTYKTELSWWIFVIPLFAMWLIVLITIGQQAIRAALVNPIESLNYE